MTYGEIMWFFYAFLRICLFLCASFGLCGFFIFHERLKASGALGKYMCLVAAVEVMLFIACTCIGVSLAL